MANQENLPARAPGRDVAAATHASSLVARGLEAIHNGASRALVQGIDSEYRKARAVYSLVTDDGRTTWVGEQSGRRWVPMSALDDAFEAFRRLAREGYGKAYYPLSTLYGGQQSVEGDENLAQHFAGLAFEWCFANRFRNDPDIWNDLGHLYLHHDNEQALHWFHKAAEQGHAWACFNLTGMYEFGCGVERDYDEALRWQIKAAEQGNLAAILGLTRQYESADSDIADDEQALYWYRKAAEHGYPWSEADFGGDRFCELGKRFRYVDDEKAQEYFLEAAGLEHAEAMYELAMLLSENVEDADWVDWLERSVDLGFGPAQLAYAEFVSEDEAQPLINAAVDWYKTRAEAGDSVWQYEYALLLLRGNPEEGLRWLEASAEQGYRQACRRLGHEYLRAEVSDYTTQQAIHWFSRAADLGDAWACESLARLYLLGHGEGTYAASNGRKPRQRIEPDKKMAVRWYERGIAIQTSRGGSSIAFKLGELYLKGEYIDQDLQLGEKWLLHSAKEGHASAQECLGSEYASGVRLRQDADAAIHWLKLAAESHSSARLKLAEIYLDGKITPKDFWQASDWLIRCARVGAYRRNDAMKLIAEKCFDGRFNADDEACARAVLDRLASEARSSVSDTDDIHAASNAYRLAELYELGLGFGQDTEKAIYWYRQSAERGSYVAKTRLNELGVDWRAS